MSGSQSGVSAETVKSLSTTGHGSVESSLRLYNPLQPFFDKTWRPGEIEPI